MGKYVKKIKIDSRQAKCKPLLDLYNFRELLFVFAVRDILVRYKQTFFGIIWAILQPLIVMIVLSYVFGTVVGLKTKSNTPYYTIVLTGVLPWFLFSSILSTVSMSLVDNASLVTKVYFPRIVLPVSSVIVSMVDFSINLMLLVVIILYSGILFNFSIVFILGSVLISVISALGVGLFFCALNVKYRDFRYVVPFIVQFGLYISPIGYLSGEIDGIYRYIYSLNPVVASIDLMRFAILSENKLDVLSISISSFVAVIFLIIGLRVFNKMENSMADVI